MSMIRRWGEILFIRIPPHRWNEWIQQEFGVGGLLEAEWFYQPAIWNQWHEGREVIVNVSS